MPRFSRRRFAASAMLAPAWLNRVFGAPADPRVAKIVAESLAIDMHNHVYPAGTEQGPQRGDAGPTLSLGDELKLSGLTFQHIGILSLEFHVDKLSRPLL